MKVYTKTGDQGFTSLTSGQKVSKANLRIEAYGAIDELNAQLGLLRDQLHENFATAALFAGKILPLQEELFEIGSELATPAKSPLSAKLQASIAGATLSRLELEIDVWQAELPPLANFLIPGGHSLNSQAHIARTIARRAERRVVELHEQEGVRPILLQYLNRLSDWLFVLSRAVSARLECPETIWSGKK
jgi:cob(I)alamin adenosyltransferase